MACVDQSLDLREFDFESGKSTVRKPKLSERLQRGLRLQFRDTSLKQNLARDWYVVWKKLEPREPDDADGEEFQSV